MLQGYLPNANFGDVLYAHLFYRACQSMKLDKVDFYQFRRSGIGTFCRKELDYTRKKTFLACLGADALVLISGGSLWNDSSISWDARARYLRFVLPARLYQLMGKPVYILGAGGGPVDTIWLRRAMVRMLNRAELVLFRDEKTLEVFRDYGVKNQMTVTADTALVVTPELLEPLEEKEQLEQAAAGRKKLLLHIPDGARECGLEADNIVPGLIQFLKQQPNYLVILSNDNQRNLSQEEQRESNRIRESLRVAGVPIYEYRYHNSWQMCSLIGEMDCVVTEKLHVGVLGIALGKSVLSFPVHREKTMNFYTYIGMPERCVPVVNASPETVCAQLLRYHDHPLTIGEEFRRKAQMNLDALKQI